MRMPKRKIYKSLIFKLTLGSLLIITPLVFFLIFDNFYSIKILHEKVAESKLDTISLYMNQIDSELKNIDDYLLRIVTYDMSISNMENSDEGTRVLARVNLSNNIVQAISSYKMIDGMFVYSKSTRDYMYSYSTRTDIYKRKALSDYLTNLIDEGTSYNKTGWFPVTTDSSYYILRIINTGDTYVGAWITVETLINYLNDIDLKQKGSILLVTSQGLPMNNIDYIQSNRIGLSGDLNSYYFSGKNKDFMVIGRPSKFGDFRLMAVNNEKSLLEGLDLIQITIIFIALLSVLCIPLTFVILRRWIFKPVKKLKHAIDKIESGDLDYRVKLENHPYEFMMLNRAFNKMVSQITQLKIDVYEEQISKQKAELQYLQMQIKPHFYLNAFNTIYSMAQMKDFNLIQDMVRCLADYLRYSCRNNFILVPLEEELKHVKNYLQIQRIRSGENLICNIDTDQSLMDLHIPPLILHTFIENIVKHAVNIYEPVIVLIKIDLIEKEQVKFARIIIQDSGKGFSEEVLVGLNSNDICKEDGKSIGIWNAKQRIKLIYGEKAGITLSNGENSGAHVEIILPLETEQINL